MRTRAIAWAVLLLGLIAACGGDDGGDGGDSAATTDGGGATDTGEGAAPAGDVWSGELESGAPITARLWVEPSSGEAIEQWDELRTLLDGPEYALTEVTVDNTDGDTQETGRFLTFVTGDDPLDQENVVESTFVCSLIDGWEQPATESEDEEYLAVYEDVCDGQTAQVLVPPGETVTYWVAIEGDEPPAFDTIYAGVGNELRPA